MSISPSKTTGTVPQRLSLPSNPTAQDKEEWSLEKGLLNHGTTNSFSVTSVCLLTHLYTNLYTTNKDSQMHHKKPHRAPSQGRRQPMTKQGQEPRPRTPSMPFGQCLWALAVVASIQGCGHPPLPAQEESCPSRDGPYRVLIEVPS